MRELHWKGFNNNEGNSIEEGLHLFTSLQHTLAAVLQSQPRARFALTGLFVLKNILLGWVIIRVNL